MNITIIIPAMQPAAVVDSHSRKDPGSPQPTTTPFPPISISPSPTNAYSMTSSVNSNYNHSSANSVGQLCSACQSSMTQCTSETESMQSLRAYEQVELEVQDRDNNNRLKSQSPSPSPTPDSIPSESPPVIAQLLRTNDDRDSETERLEAQRTAFHERIQNFASRESESFETHATESASSPDTVIHVSTLRRQDSIDQDYEDDFLEEDVEIQTPNPDIPNYLLEQLGDPLPKHNENDNTLNSSDTNGSNSHASATVSTTEQESQINRELHLAPQTKSSPKGITGVADSNYEKRSTGRGRKYPNPRKPSLYPQRLNKVTLARQALAREKRRAYVEERIQRYIRNSQQTGSYKNSYKYDPPTTEAKSTAGSLKDEPSPFYTKYYSPTPSEPLPLIQMQMRRLGSASASLPDLESNNYYVNNPSPILLPKTIIIPVARVHTRNSSFKSLPPSSASSLPMPHILFNSKEGLNQNQNTTGTSMFRDTDSISELNSQIWNSMEQQSYFYSFRVRQTGPVQMLDKSIQTTNSEFSHGYTLNFTSHVETSSSTSTSTNHIITQQSKGMLGKVPGPGVDNRDKILRDIAETVQQRHDAELRRAELVQRANDLQSRVKDKRDKINRRHEFWHKKYIEESSLTRPLEASCNSLRAELNTIHRRLLAHLEGRDLPLRLRDGPSKKANYKIMSARLQHEIKELQQKVKAAKLRLESEIKLKEQADRETRAIRNDLSHKKVLMSLARSQGATLPAVHPKPYDPLLPLPRPYDPIHARSYDSLYQRTYDPLAY